MYQTIKSLKGRTLSANDGEIGSVADFYFDDKSWAIRYLVANTGSWLTGRLVLISPYSLGRARDEAKTLHVNLTRAQIENSPPIDNDKPVSRQYEVDYYHYYGWPVYWAGGGMWGVESYPAMLPFSPAEREAAQHSGDNNDPHLRSIKVVTGYVLQASDGEIGSVRDFMVDDKTWVIGQFVVETGHWYSGKEILIPTEKITRISYTESKVYVELSLADLKATRENEVAAAGGGTSAVTYARI